MSTAPRTCSLEECERRHYAKGLCKGHYERSRKGRPLAGAIRTWQGRRWQVRRLCSLDECELKHYAKGLCGLHYERARRQAVRTAAIREQLEELHGRGWLYRQGGSVCIENIAYREYPGIDIDRLAYCLRDNRMDWNAAIADYLKMSEQGAAR